MIKVIPFCTACAQVIHNPVCPQCFLSHVLYWMRDKHLSRAVMKNVIEELLDFVHISETSPAEMSCVSCNSRKVNLCTQCFHRAALRTIRKYTKNKTMISAFQEDFNLALTIYYS